MKSNNPILEAVEESFLKHAGASFRAIVSIGTGRPSRTRPGGHALDMVKYAFAQMTDTEAKHEEFLRRFPDITAYSNLKPNDYACYFRLNEETSLHSIDLADWKRLDQIKAMAEEYVKSVTGLEAIKSCAAYVAKRV
jgi:hypothetical protein